MLLFQRYMLIYRETNEHLEVISEPDTDIEFYKIKLLKTGNQIFLRRLQAQDLIKMI